jgi:hypothetical protein
MAALTSQPTSSAPAFKTPQDNEALEPDEEWRDNLRKTIQQGIQSMIDDAKKSRDESLHKAPVNEEERDRIAKDHMETLDNIRRLANEQFASALERERVERRWAANQPVDPKWEKVLAMEQQAIMDNIKKDDAQSERSYSRASNDASRSQYHTDAISATGPASGSDWGTGHLPPTSRWDPTNGFVNASIYSNHVGDRNHGQGTAPTEGHPDRRKPSQPAVAESGRFELPESTGQSIDNRRRPSNASFGSISRDHTDGLRERSRNISLGSHGYSSNERRSSEPWNQHPLYDEPEEMDQPARSSNERGDSGRTHSIWKPAISPEEDAAHSKTFRQARRGSNASMASSYRSSGTNHISERSIDPVGVMGHTDRERVAIQAIEEQWAPMTQARERKKQRPRSSDRRQSTATEDQNQRLPERLSGSVPQSSLSDNGPPASATIPVMRRRPSSLEDHAHQTFSSHNTSHNTRGWSTSSLSPNAPSNLRSHMSRQELRFDTKDSHSVGMQEVYARDEDSEDSGLDNAAVGDSELDAKRREAALKEEESKWHEAELRQMQEEARRMEEEIKLREAEIKRREEELERKRKEEEVRQKVEEIKKKEEELKRREEELNRREAESKRKEEENRRKEDERKRMDEENRRREDERKRKDAESRWREEEARRKEAEKQKVQQDEFRKREEDIRRRTDERRRQDSFEFAESLRWGSTLPSANAPAGAGPWPRRESVPTGTSSSTDRSSTGSSSRGSAATNWSGSSRTTTGTQASSTSRASTGRTDTPPPTSRTPGSAGKATFSEAEWARRQEEQAREQQEKFRKEQERQERERQAKEGRMMTKDEILRMFDAHERQWNKIPTLDMLSWESFPWPTLKRPKEPDDLTPFAIESYVLSPFGDKTKSEKDRIKDHIKRWHPDRFETKLLPKVIEKEREKVKEGAGSVVRALNSFLTRPKDSLFS